MTENFSPAVSVIVPVFNAEKYLPACLESLLIQTLTDIEVVVVDDGSTDGSVEVAESFLERFGGRLKVVTLEENTGSGAVPRNVGLDFARGKYVYFVDDDDLLLDVALETLYDFAQTFDADVVYTDKSFHCDIEPVPAKLEVDLWSHSNSFVEEPTLETDDITERISAFLAKRFHWAPWTKFLRRDLLVDNDIKFPATMIWEDVAWTFSVLCSAKKILHVSEPLYIYRINENSILQRKRTAEQHLVLLSRSLPCMLNYIDGLMRKVDVLRKDPVLFMNILQIFAQTILSDLDYFAKDLSAKEAYEIFRREFSKDATDCAALLSYLLIKNRPGN